MRATALPAPSGATIQVWQCPLLQEASERLLGLLHTEWDSGDYDWRAAFRGDFSDTLTFRIAVAQVNGEDAATACVVYPKQDPEIGVVNNVLTREAFRGEGLGAHLSECVTRLAFEAGCRVVYLGTTPRPDSVYLRIGYTFVNGGVMRRAALEGDRFEEDEYFQPGQRTSVREAVWGDLPGFSALFARPYEWLAGDFQRQLFSGRSVEQRRCASIFGHLREDVRKRQGVCCVLAGDKAHRILGVASVTPGVPPVAHHSAVADILTHENYYGEAARLLTDCLRRAEGLGARRVTAFVAGPDVRKLEILREVGFSESAVLPDQIRVGGVSYPLHVLTRQTS
ncbi:MAG: GNAT family N-acetyltransferase [Bryobacteraceae bacterium]